MSCADGRSFPSSQSPAQGPGACAPALPEDLRAEDMVPFCLGGLWRDHEGRDQPVTGGGYDFTFIQLTPRPIPRCCCHLGKAWGCRLRVKGPPVRTWDRWASRGGQGSAGLGWAGAGSRATWQGVTWRSAAQGGAFQEGRLSCCQPGPGAARCQAASRRRQPVW